MENHAWEEIDEFTTLDEVERLVVWIIEQCSLGIAYEIPVLDYAESGIITARPLEKITIDKYYGVKRWFIHMVSGEVWELHGPDAPFHGTFKKLKELWDERPSVDDLKQIKRIEKKQKKIEDKLRIYDKADKRRLYQLMNMCLSKEIDSQFFCDEYHNCYKLLLDNKSLEEVEAESFDELEDIVTRFTYDCEALKKFPGAYCNEEELKQKIIETKEKLKEQTLVGKIIDLLKF